MSINPINNSFPQVAAQPTISEPSNLPLSLKTSASASDLVQFNPNQGHVRFTALAGALFHQVNTQRTLWGNINDKGQMEVTTADGFKIVFSGKKEEWTITSPDGRTTRIWGDPHVDESDGDSWDFYKQGTFLFGDSKATVEVVSKGNSKKTYSETVTIYNGNDRFTVTNIAANNPEFVDWARDGIAHDKKLQDGSRFYLSQDTKGKDTWVSKNPEWF